MTTTVSKRFKHFGGEVIVYDHVSSETKTPMTFAVFLPPSALTARSSSVPVIFWLSGLTCTWENFATKAGAFGKAAEHGVAIVMPATSPSPTGIEGETDSWDFGSKAGFYVDAVAPKFAGHYRMHSYVTAELPAVLGAELPVLNLENASVMGHSMGGLGALICALRHPGKYRAVSAFAPIADPSKSFWGIKAFKGYLGDDEAAWAAYNPCALIASYKGPALPIHVDQGLADEWLAKGALLPENFLAAAAAAGVEVKYSPREGYDHSYWYISTFIGEHIAEHAAILHGAAA